MGIPGDLGKEEPHHCSPFWGPLPWPCHLSQNRQILGALCLRLSCGFPCPQHHEGAPGGAHGLAELGPTSSACGASADLAVLLPVLTRNLSYLQGVDTTPGGSVFRGFGCTVSVEQGCAFIGSSSCY